MFLTTVLCYFSYFFCCQFFYIFNFLLKVVYSLLRILHINQSNINNMSQHFKYYEESLAAE